MLANEQIDSEGRSWRSGAKAERKKMNQWYLDIVKYAPEMLKELDNLPGWPSAVKESQRGWIGQEQGYAVPMKLRSKNSDESHQIEIFLPEEQLPYLHQAKFLALSNDHISEHDSQRILSLHSEQSPNQYDSYLLSINDLIVQGQNLKEKKSLEPGYHLGDLVMGVDGFELELPVFFCSHIDNNQPFQLGIPAINERDQAFVEANQAIFSGVVDEPEPIDESQLSALRTKFQNTSIFKLRNWLVSRQRYWGVPIPIIHCSSCDESFGVEDSDLPLDLVNIDFTLAKEDKRLQAELSAYETTCPSCKGTAHYDRDTLDTFVDSSWYFLRFLDN